MIKLPKRFALSTLLVVMVATAILFGAAQWRRQRLIAEVASLRTAGVEGLVVSDDWFWPTASGTAVIRLPNDVYFGSPDMRERFAALRDRAVACGAGDVAYEMAVMRYYQVVARIRTKDLDQTEGGPNATTRSGFSTPHSITCSNRADAISVASVILSPSPRSG